MRNIQHTSIDEGGGLSGLNADLISNQLAAVYSRFNAAVNMRAVSADTTLTYKDSLVFVDTSGGNITITLAPANSWGASKSPTITIIKTSTSNTLTVTAGSGDTLNTWVNSGTLTAGSITTAGQVQLVTDGSTKYYAVSESPVVYSNTYTPTLSNTTNIAASTAYACPYMRIGNVCHVAGRVAMDVTTSVTESELGMTLPIASAFTVEEDLGGVFAQHISGSSREAGTIRADATNDRAKFAWYSFGIANYSFYFSFTYVIK